MDMYLKWFREGEKLTDFEAQNILRKNKARYKLIKGFSMSLLMCVDEFEKERIMHENHEGACGSHISGRSLAMKILIVGFFRPTLRNDCLGYVKKCDKC